MIFINMISLKKLIIEGRYDSLITSLSNKLLSIIKDSYSATKDIEGQFSGAKIYYRTDEPVPNIEDESKQKNIFFEEIENQTIPLEFYLSLKVQWIQGFDDLTYGAGAYNETSKNAETPPLIEIRFKIDPIEYPTCLSQIATMLRDSLRHEIEHLTQSGWNVIDSKYIRSDQSIRDKIESSKLPAVRYFTLKKEIPAMIQGMYFSAKKSKTPFKQVINAYLDNWVDRQDITLQDKEDILTVWRSYLPRLGIRQEL